MNPTTFDDLTKALATSTSRRQALKAIAATTIGGILALSGIGTVLAKPTCKPNGHGCGTNKQCCNGYCDPTRSTCGCPPGTTQLNGTCCPNDQVCGSICGCPPSQVCSGGVCGCPPGTTMLCNGTCAVSCSSSGCPGSCGCAASLNTGETLCSQPGGSLSRCNTDCDCKTGEWCLTGNGQGECITACGG
nr:hypothetical protein [Ktedonobacteraceae bacterium]